MDHFSKYGMGFNGISAAIKPSERSTTSFKIDPKKTSALELLMTYKPSYHRSNVGRLDKLINKERQPREKSTELSTEEVMRVAAACFIRMSGDPSDPLGLLFTDLKEEEMKNVDLAVRLLAAAEMVRNQQYDWASELIRQCYELASTSGNPVQRVVYYFSEALQEKINRLIGWSTVKRPRESIISAQDVNQAIRTNHPVQLVIQHKLPFSQIVHFVSIQTIIDNLESAKRIHMIDISIKHGLQWTVLMQALSTRSCPIEYLKISAVGCSEEAITMTGKSLTSFAKTLGISFEYKSVILKDFKDLKQNMFDVKEGEAIGVYSSMDMNTLIVGPDSLENLISILSKLKPCIMTVTDVEAKHNSPSFINRFTEGLFYYSALFDYLNGFMDDNDKYRMFIEGSFISQGIKSLITAEGDERVIRHVGISVWRSFFARFGLMETELSDWSQYQATELVKQFSHGDLCTLEVNGKSLMIGWKGTPLLFVSAWKFS